MGHVLLIPQQGVYSVLLGMNRHGRIAVFDWAGVALSFVLDWVLMGPLQMGMIGAAIALSVPMTLCGGVLMPLYACRILEISAVQYFREIAPKPLLAVLPLTLILVACRVITPDHSLIAGLTLGALVTVPIYWMTIVPLELRTRIVEKIWHTRGRRVAPPGKAEPDRH